MKADKEFKSSLNSKSQVGGRGKVNISTNHSTGRTRLRFYGVAPDQLETILIALGHARSELGTEHDAVALDAICMAYLANSD